MKKAKFLIFQVEIRTKDAHKDEILNDVRQSLSRILSKKKNDVKYDFAKRIYDAEKSGKRDEVKKLLKELQHAIKENKQ
jgi:hypothetical protein